MKQIEHTRLQNGLDIYCIKYDSPVTFAQLYTPFGGDTLRYKDTKSSKNMRLKPGSAHYFEHVLFIMPPRGESITTLTPERQDNLTDGLTELHNLGAIDANAYTSNDHTNYHFITRKNFEPCLDLLLDFVFTPYLPKERFAQEVGTILDEAKRGLNHATHAQYNQWHEQAFKKHGARNPIVGTLDSIPKISLEDVLSMHSTFYAPSNMSLVIAGHVDLQSVSTLAQKRFESLGKENYVNPPKKTRNTEPVETVIRNNLDNPMTRKDIIRPSVLMGWKQVLDPTRMSTSDMIDQHTMMSLIGDMLFSRGSYRRESFIAKGFDEDSFDGRCHSTRETGLIYGWGDTDDPREYVRLIQAEVDCLKKTGFEKKELDHIRSGALMNIERSMQKIVQFSLILAKWDAKTGDLSSFPATVNRLKTITLDEVNEKIEDYLADSKLSIVSMVPEEK